MKRSRCRATYVVAAFGIGVLLSLICPSQVLLVVTISVLVLVSVGGIVC